MDLLKKKINKEIDRAKYDRKFLPKDTKFMGGMIHGLKVARNIIEEASQQDVEADVIKIETCPNCGYVIGDECNICGYKLAPLN